MNIRQLKSYTITLSNSLNEKLLIGYDGEKNQYFIDRTQSGKTDFNKDFAGKFAAPRFSYSTTSDITIVVDRSSIELFADDGLTVMSCIFFPDSPYDQMELSSTERLEVVNLKLIALRSIWTNK